MGKCLAIRTSTKLWGYSSMYHVTKKEKGVNSELSLIFLKIPKNYQGVYFKVRDEQ